MDHSLIMLLSLVLLFGMILQSGLNCLNCWLQKLLHKRNLGLTMLAKAFRDVKFLWHLVKILDKTMRISEDRSCSCCACCRYSCWPLTTLSEQKITIHLESSVFSFFSFFFLGIELSWCRWWSQDKHVRLPRLTQLCLASLESLPFLFLPMASTEVGCVLLSLAFLFAVLHLFTSFLNLP